MKSAFATDEEIEAALCGPVVPSSIAGFPAVLICDVKPVSPRVVSVLAVKVEGDAVVWGKRIFMSPLDSAVIALQSAEGKN